ncbi:MAG: hypothetical protein NDP13_05650 [Crenarchaeota archaeon]|nr:hypothetical protein [Thermoproteota archaeon]MCR8454452.1 hypothetical protein [Thermoproteota archaeon]MCR8463510.1 hypothetical protein [Thermoproteota archaeon]MCR8471206.1 hypothetical protein [Thermoproteota archaeon]MCR8472000.1 hypothetical protein [Thermoproteota archaeon]
MASENGYLQFLREYLKVLYNFIKNSYNLQSKYPEFWSSLSDRAVLSIVMRNLDEKQGALAKRMIDLIIKVAQLLSRYPKISDDEFKWILELIENSSLLK